MSEIIVDSVTLSYPIFSANARSLKKSLLGFTGGILSTAPDRTLVVKALDNISFHLKQGDRVGLLGHNGAGKSTLLKMLARVYPPIAGQIITYGKVASILNIGIGMCEDATGYENIYMKGLILGLSKKQINAMIPEIEEFTELGDYLSMPIRTYSSGMRVRLSFAISTNIQSEILLLDEVIGVGDAHFIERAEKRLNDIVNKANIMVFASHSDGMIKKMCNKGLLLEHGKLKFFGDVHQALAIYHGDSN